MAYVGLTESAAARMDALCNEHSSLLDNFPKFGTEEYTQRSARLRELTTEIDILALADVLPHAMYCQEMGQTFPFLGTPSQPPTAEQIEQARPFYKGGFNTQHLNDKAGIGPH